MVDHRRPGLLLGGTVFLFVFLAGLMLLVLPHPHQPFTYLVAGTFATGISLFVVFVLFVARRL